MPDQMAFEEPVMALKKQKRECSPPSPMRTPPREIDISYFQTSPSTPLVCPKAPTKTPLRSPINTKGTFPVNQQLPPPTTTATINNNNNNNNIITTFTASTNSRPDGSGAAATAADSSNFHGIHFLTQRKRAKSSSTHFEYLAKLGEGCFGEVWKARSVLNDHFYAIKKSKKPIWETNERSHHLQEIEKGMRLGTHSNIVSVIAAWEEGGHLYIQMELCEHGNLKSKLTQCDGAGIDEQLLWTYIADISRGLEHVHSNGIIHLDIKPENLLFSNDGSLKICDFGVSVANGDTEGDQVYMAPELLDDVHTQAADIFSFGITIYECITNYELPTQGQWWRNLREGRIPFPDHLTISHELKSLITSMMDPDPLNRVSITRILEIPRVREIVEFKKKQEQPLTKFKLQRRLF
ncbi:hypothetical protein SAMD00019534_083160 [Acytostelium subglobosum LB1]|uniref:hypothetical protein n=1 Tax=Acytostelium subglobosum LB1 TaxID=1410327 RepID=UPI000644DA9B|nr:hypothetical protein SAMD00019534_083160 [Acytostelium subglobosum LB1]GAM25141.1 hypothetical protein SAMD00019534_083160 [Acytostelium subglobosum LB1]|eukprot:XP_012751661.1 hypothetical protein SAMD00019534_083160 [Acytostelium subglobosum LB1]